jgi:hypothetical protein
MFSVAESRRRNTRSQKSEVVFLCEFRVLSGKILAVKICVIRGK